MTERSQKREECGILTCIRVKDVDEALALGRSSALHSPWLRRAVVVEGELLPRDRRKLLACFHHLTLMRPEHFRLGWQAKNVVYQYSPFQRTLFLDADCLVMRDLRPVFDLFRGKPVAFSAKSIPAQEMGNSLFAKVSLEVLLAHFRTDWWPQILGGGHFYFEQTDTTCKLFEGARLWANLKRLRPFGWDQPNVSDELTLQLAIVEAGFARQCTICDLTLMLWTPSVSGNPDVLAGMVDGFYAHGVPFSTNEFYVVHFGGDHSNVYYRRERYRLALQSWAAAHDRLLAITLIRLVNRRAMLGAVARVTRRSERLFERVARVSTDLVEAVAAFVVSRKTTASKASSRS